MFCSFCHFQLANRMWYGSCLFIDFVFGFDVISVVHSNHIVTLYCNLWLRRSYSINVVDQRFIHIITVVLLLIWKIGKRYMMVKYNLGTDKNLISHTHTHTMNIVVRYSHIFQLNKKNGCVLFPVCRFHHSNPFAFYFVF